MAISRFKHYFLGQKFLIFDGNSGVFPDNFSFPRHHLYRPGLLIMYMMLRYWISATFLSGYLLFKYFDDLLCEGVRPTKSRDPPNMFALFFFISGKSIWLQGVWSKDGPKTMKKHETTLKNHGNQPKTMKNHGNQPKTMKNVTNAGSQLTF